MTAGASRTMPPVGGDADSRPTVASPSAGIPFWVLIAAAMTLGLVVLLTLNGRRVARSAMLLAPARAYPRPPILPAGLAGLGAADPAGGTGPNGFGRDAAAPVPFGGPPAGDVPSAPPGMSPFAAAPGSAGPSSPTTGSEGAPTSYSFATRPMPGGLTAASGTFGGGGGATGGSAVVFDAGRAGGDGGSFGDGKGTAGDDGIARASLIRNRAAVVAQGEIMAATLETPVDSARPGLIRAIVARDVRSFDGSRVLIPRGSRLIGECRPDTQAGRRRILATWSRLIRPDGVAIRIDSPAGDPAGATGMPGKVDSHFLARFANAVLQSAMQIGVNLASRAGNGAVIVSNSATSPSIVGQGIIAGADAPTSVSVRSGAAISVFVARDLDFTGVPAVR